MLGDLFMSALFLVLVNYMARSGTRRSIAKVLLVCPFVAVFGIACGNTLVLLGNASLVFIAGLLCLAFQPRPGLFLKFSLAVTPLAYIYPSITAVAYVQKWDKLREEHPFESMKERLIYEGGRTQGPKTDSPFITDLEQELDRRVTATGWDEAGNHPASWRTRTLQYIHAGYVRQFIDSPGFGRSRMVGRPNPNYLQLHDLEPIPLPTPAYEDPSQSEMTTAPLGKLTEALAGVLQGLHREGFLDFLNPKRFGYIQDREHVAGFVSHRFLLPPTLDSKENWEIQDLALVSLLKFDEPAVYISQHLPRMDELRDAPTRRLDNFEREALEGLRQGENLQVRSSPNQIRMLGAIRSLRQCASCHGTERGELLGAFSYKLRRGSAQP